MKGNLNQMDLFCRVMGLIFLVICLMLMSSANAPQPEQEATATLKIYQRGGYGRSGFSLKINDQLVSEKLKSRTWFEVRVDLDKVLYIRSDTNLLFFHQEGKTVSTRMTISKALELLPVGEFVRAHKSYIVSVRKIRKIERHQLTVGSEVVPLAGSYKEEVQRLLLG